MCLRRILYNNRISDELDLIIVSLGNRQRPEEQIDIYEIPYRNNELIIHSGKYKPYIREFEFIAKNKYLIPEINKWLSGSGKLDIEDDYKYYTQDGYYNVSVVEGWEYELYTNHMYQFIVKFKIEPFYYYNSGNLIKTITSPSRIYNPGTIYSEPYIKINASGNVDLSINSNVISFTNIEEYIEIDSSLMTVYKDTINQGERMQGEFPIFNTDKNYISWNGNVSSIQIKGRWREL